MKRLLILFFLAASTGIVFTAAYLQMLGNYSWRTTNKKGPVRKLMLITAYCSDQNCRICVNVARWRDGKTALGDDARILDGVAADFNLLPPRTKLWIPGVGYREVDDTGSQMIKSAKEKGIYHIDVRVRTHKEARSFAGGKGKIVAFVKVLDPIPDPPYRRPPAKHNRDRGILNKQPQR